MFFQIGDFLVGMLVGVLTALAVRVLMWPGIDMVIAMLIGMGIGMIIHFVIAFAVVATASLRSPSRATCAA